MQMSCSGSNSSSGGRLVVVVVVIVVVVPAAVVVLVVVIVAVVVVVVVVVDAAAAAIVVTTIKKLIVVCILGCIECPWEKFFSSQSTNKGNRKLPLYMGFKNIEKFFRNFNVSCSHQRVEVIENRDFP